MESYGLGRTETLILLPVLVVALGILAWALVDLIKRPADKVRYLPKWAWFLVVLLGNTTGQIVYLIIGRDRTTSAPEATAADAATAESVADALYKRSDRT